MEPRVERADINYFRPRQVEDVKHEIAASEEKLKNPLIEDKAEVARQLRNLRTMEQTQSPHPPKNGEEEGRLVSRSRELLNRILVGMPSAEEMRKAPPGAVDKHMGWEKRNKADIIEWKNIQLRLKPGEAEAANLERHRPSESSLNMDNAFIHGKQFYLPPEGAARSVTFSDEQLALLRSVDPQVADMIGAMNNKQRAEVKEVLTTSGIGLVEPPKEEEPKKARKKPKKHKKHVLAPEHLEAARARMAIARAAKAKQAAE